MCVKSLADLPRDPTNTRFPNPAESVANAKSLMYDKFRLLALMIGLLDQLVPSNIASVIAEPTGAIYASLG